jgi:hypothetical protein
MTDEAKIEEPKVEEKKPEGWKPGDGAKAVGKAMRDNPGHAVGGAIVGQILIPIPVVGAVIGASVTSWWAKKNDPAQNKE